MKMANKRMMHAVQAKNKLYNMYKVRGGKRLLVTGN
jgi:hypothetical protein